VREDARGNKLTSDNTLIGTIASQTNTKEDTDTFSKTRNHTTTPLWHSLGHLRGQVLESFLKLVHREAGRDTELRVREPQIEAEDLHNNNDEFVRIHRETGVDLTRASAE
jgi:hypothetical protein